MPTTQTATEETPKRRGRPPKSEAKATSTKKKRRGRPPKSESVKAKAKKATKAKAKTKSAKKTEVRRGRPAKEKPQDIKALQDKYQELLPSVLQLVENAQGKLSKSIEHQPHYQRRFESSTSRGLVTAKQNLEEATETITQLLLLQDVAKTLSKVAA